MLCQIETIQCLRKMIEDRFPEMELSVCYGSLALPQTCNDNRTSNDSNTKRDLDKETYLSGWTSSINKPLLDFIFVVNNSRGWHSMNIIKNPNDYSLLSRFGGSNYITFVQNIGSGVFYNLYIPIEWKLYIKQNIDTQIKYGIIGTQKLINDLVYWESIYVSGRLHKPTIFLQNNSNEYNLNELISTYNNDINNIINKNVNDITLKEALVANWDYAVAVSLLLLHCQHNGFVLLYIYIYINILQAVYI